MSLNIFKDHVKENIKQKDKDENIPENAWMVSSLGLVYPSIFLFKAICYWHMFIPSLFLLNCGCTLMLTFYMRCCHQQKLYLGLGLYIG